MSIIIEAPLQMYAHYRVLADLLKEEEKKKKLAVKLLGSRLEYALYSILL